MKGGLHSEREGVLQKLQKERQPGEFAGGREEEAQQLCVTVPGGQGLLSPGLWSGVSDVKALSCTQCLCLSPRFILKALIPRGLAFGDRASGRSLGLN